MNEVNACYVDLEKAYDCISRDKLWAVLLTVWRWWPVTNCYSVVVHQCSLKSEKFEKNAKFLGKFY